MKRRYVFEAVLAIALIGMTGALFVAITNKPAAVTEGWEISGNGSVDYLLAGSDDTLYVFDGNEITAVGSNGSLRWKIEVPAQWRVLNSWTPMSEPAKPRPLAAEKDGHLYLLAVQRPTAELLESLKNGPLPDTLRRNIEIMAIAPDGHVEWEYLSGVEPPSREINNIWNADPNDPTMVIAASLALCDGRLYLFYGDTQEVLDDRGRHLFSIEGLAAPAAVDEDGHMYAVRAIWPYNINSFSPYPSDIDQSGLTTRYPGDAMSTSVIVAYGPDGTLLWNRDIGHAAIRQWISEDVRPEHASLPLYFDGKLYVPIKDGIIALDRQGNTIWSSRLPDFAMYSLLETMPMDDAGNVYMTRDHAGVASLLIVISPDGERQDWPGFFASDDHLFSDSVFPVLLAAKDGVMYAINSTARMDARTFSWVLKNRHFDPDRVTAYDVANGAELWNFTVPAEDKRVVILSKKNIREALPDFTDEMIYQRMVPAGFRPQQDYAQGYGYAGRIKVYPGPSVTYVDYYWAIYETPIVYTKSACIYARSIYALDAVGRLLWKKPVEGYITAGAANNSTFYYGTRDGRIGAVGAGPIVAGIAIAALAYVILRFFMLGSVARARARLEKNENRNAIMKFVADNPGVTATDIARGLKANLGTVRYHLFILSMNHKVSTHNEGDKYLRYFTNSGTYGKEDRSLLSLMRREPLRKALAALMEKPGMSNLELAGRMNVSAVSAHDHLRELLARGIVDKVPNPDRGYSYYIRSEHAERIARLIVSIQ